MYDIKTRAMARPDPFTGTMGRMLEERIKDLELFVYVKTIKTTPFHFHQWVFW